MGMTDDQNEKAMQDLSRRNFLKVAGSAVTLAAIPSLLQGTARAQENSPAQEDLGRVACDFAARREQADGILF